MKLAAAVLLVLALAAHAGAPAFRHERVVTPGGVGPNRLAVDVALLAGARALRLAPGAQLVGGLEDLRLYDASGTEVPYLVVPPPAAVERWLGGHTLPVRATEKESGFEVDLGQAERVDRLRLRGLPAPFMKRARVEGSGDRSRWDVLLDEATLFDLPAEGLRGTDVGFTPADFRYLRVTWDDRASARVPMPTAEAHLAVREASSPPTTFPVAFERRASEPGRSRFRLRLPGPDLPVQAFLLGCAGGHLLREARIGEARLSGAVMVPLVLGSGTLRRTVQDGLVAADLRVAIRPPHEADLDLVVEDGSNPPLELTDVTAELAPLPWLYFESPTGASLTARYGDPTLGAPRYDLEAMRDAVKDRVPGEATWGSVRALVPAEPEPAAMSTAIAATGAEIDPVRFRWARRIPSGAVGLTALVLDAAVLAHSNDLADVRIADARGRQVPYVVERLDEPLEVELADPRPATDAKGPPKSESRYEVSLPHAGLPRSRLVLATSARVFERRIWVTAERAPADGRGEKRQETIASAAWRHADPESAAQPLVLELPTLRTSTLTLVVDEGDNSRLPLARPKLLLPAHRLRFFHAAEEDLTLLYGQPGVGRPRYDLALLAPKLAGASAHEIAADPEGAAPAAETPGVSTMDQRVFWGVLIVAVMVLVVLVARLTTAKVA